MKAMFWTLLIAAGIASCGSRIANSAPVVELVPVEESQAPETVVFDKTIHDFGDVSVTDGPLTCTFTVTNKGKDPISVYEVVSSCGCTDVKWTKGTLGKGESGTISATVARAAISRRGKAFSPNSAMASFQATPAPHRNGKA